MKSIKTWIKMVFLKAFIFANQNKVLTLILLVTALLRFIGISPGYHPYHSDEGMSYSSAIDMIRNLNLDPTRYDYPSLVPLIHTALYVFFFIPTFLVKSILFSQGDLPTKAKNLMELWQQAVIQNQQTHVLYWGRNITALFGVGVVFLTFKLAKDFFSNSKIALASAFLVAVNFRQVLNSHLGLPDIYNAFFLLLCFILIGRLKKSPRPLNYLLAGLGMGLYFSVKYQPYVLPAFLLVHLIISAFKKTPDLKSEDELNADMSFSFRGETPLFQSGENVIAAKIQKKPFFVLNYFLKFAILTFLMAFVTVLIINPFHLIHFDQFLAINSYNVSKYGVGAQVLDFYPLWYLYNIGVGNLVSLSVILGLIVGLKRYPLSTVLLLSYIALFFYVFVYYTGGGYYTRNFVTVTPLLMIFAAVFITESFEVLLKHKVLANIMITLTVLVFSYRSLDDSITAVINFSKPWGFVQAHDWAKSNIPEKSVVVSHPWDNYPRDMNLTIIPFEQNEIFSLSEMMEAGAAYGFLNMDWLSLGSYWWMHIDTQAFLRFGGNKPNSILSKTYSYIVSQELASFSVAKFVKPWQAPDMNFIMVKVPKALSFEAEEIINYGFDSNEEFDRWRTLVVNGDNNRIRYQPVMGRLGSGAIEIKAGIHKIPVMMSQSPAIALDEGRYLLVSGWVKNAVELSKKERDGFLRINFYESKPNYDIDQKVLLSSVSPRIYGKPRWQKVELRVIPPKGAKFATVAVQANNYNEFLFDDITVFQSIEKFADPRLSPPYINYSIPDDILLPNSQGNL